MGSRHYSPPSERRARNPFGWTSVFLGCWPYPTREHGGGDGAPPGFECTDLRLSFLWKELKREPKLANMN